MAIDNINLPPHNIEAEKAVISWALLDPEMMRVYDSDKISHKDFYQKEYSYAITVSDQLDKNGNLDVVWGINVLYELSAFLLSTSKCWDYSKIVREKSLLRQILKVCQWVSWDVYEQKDTLEIFDSIEKRIFDLTQNQVGDSIEQIWDILKGRIEEYMDIVDNPDKVNAKKVMSGYRGIDDMLTGFKPGELIILAARPSMGKTAFSLNLLTDIALNQKKTAVMISLEMSCWSAYA